MRALKRLYLPLFLFFLALGCKNGSKSPSSSLSDTLIQKEKRLLIREQELLKRERQVVNRERQLDSLKNLMDTVGIYKPAIVGQWKVNMVCKETTCEGYAVGDTKTESWNISYKNNRVVVSAFANKELIRTYSGLFKTNGLQLSAVPAPDPQTQISVLLNIGPESERSMEGTRTIYKAGNCQVEFALKAEKQ